MGAVNALGESKELDQQAAGDALTQGLAGGALGAAGHGLGALAGKGVNAFTETVAPKLAPMAKDVALSATNRAIRAGSTGAAHDLSEPQLLRALEEGHVDYFDSVGDIAKKLGGARQQAGAYTEAAGNALQEAGSKPNISDVAQKWYDQANEIERTTLGSPVPKLLRDRAEELLSKGSSSFEGEFPQGDWTKRADLNEVVKFKRSVQNKGNYGSETPSVVHGANRDMAGDLNSAIRRENSRIATGDEDLQTLAQNYQDANARNSDLIALSNAANKGENVSGKRGGVGITAKMTALGSVATGHPMGLVAAGAKHLYDTRGQSTLAKLAFDVSKSLGKVGGLAVTNPAKLGQYGGVLSAAAGRGQDALNAAHFTLGQTDPEYQKMVMDLGD